VTVDFEPPAVGRDELLGFFAYDAEAPLQTSVVSREPVDGVDVATIRYDRGDGAFADAFLVGGDAAAGVVIAHGGTGPGKHLFLAQAVELARLGAAVLLADTSFPLGGATAERVEATRVQVLTQRRGLDVLAGERGATRLGFYGHSAGGMQGACLAGCEPRLDAIVVAAARGGHLRWAREEGVADRAELEAFHRLDPEHYVAIPGRRRLLFQHGRADDVIPLGEGRRLFEAAAGPKSWSEHDCGHGIDGHPAARAERLGFLDEALGLS
jgi:fermentation-respiration switch protein FrsA (DUF1100 family)